MGTGDTVTVIGLGPMGRAMAEALLRTGHSVTVWNRTASRAGPLLAAGARLAPTPSAALAASELVLISLTDYQAMWDVLEEASDGLEGRTLVNLSSDTPERTREAAAWTESRGGAFLAGGVMVPEFMVGTAEAYVYYSGTETAAIRFSETLAVLGEVRYMGSDPGVAQLLYQAHLDVFLTTLAAIVHSVAMIRTTDIKAEFFLPEVLQLVASVPEMIAPDGATDLGSRIDRGLHPDDGSSVTMLTASAQHVLAASTAAGVDVALPRAVADYFSKATALGFGGDGWTRVLDVIRGARARGEGTSLSASS
jgi:3-hydroxyisobutyrate dehydrogenase-like beta-hydroxyacid dehydrogenase